MAKRRTIQVPRYYQPWPHQRKAWARRASGKYTYYVKLWCRQSGKDTDDIQYCLKRAWDNPGTQSVYVGLDNVWITQNIFNKYVDGRKHWADYPDDLIEVKDTAKMVRLLNNPDGSAEALVKFIGFLNDQQLIGSSYDNFFVSEASLYKESAFSYIQPIWDQKLAMGKPLFVGFNGTPRGMRNVLYELLRTYTGVDDPADFAGEHVNKVGVSCYVDRKTVHDIVIPDGHGGWRPLYTPEGIEVLKDRHLREFGNLNFYMQEYECDFATVNAGLVYQGVELLERENRYRSFNLDSRYPVYMAFDIASKDKVTDATSCIVFQYHHGYMFVYDLYEARGKALVECVAELSAKPYFHLVRVAALPWDSERSASSATPIEEARRMWPQIYWHALSKERVDRGIMEVRRQLPNMVVNKDNCDWLMTCFNNYEYKRLEKADDWSAKPKHTRHSHMMDALRYAVMAMNEMSYLNINADGSHDLPDSYAGFEESVAGRPSVWRKRRDPRKERYESYG